MIPARKKDPPDRAIRGAKSTIPTRLLSYPRGKGVGKIAKATPQTKPQSLHRLAYHRCPNPKVVGSNPTGRASLATTYGDSTTHQESLAHTLPTALPTDLAEVVESWQSLPPEIRAEVLGLIRSGLPMESTEGNRDSHE
jgi:hypothetical protein